MAERIIIIFGEKSFEFLVFLLKFSWNLSTIKIYINLFEWVFMKSNFFEKFRIHNSHFMILYNPTIMS